MSEIVTVQVRCDGCGAVADYVNGQPPEGWEKDEYDGDFCPECLAMQADSNLREPNEEDMAGFVEALLEASRTGSGPSP